MNKLEILKIAVHRISSISFHEMISIGLWPFLFLIFQSILIPISVFYLFLHTRVSKFPQHDNHAFAWISGLLLLSTLVSMWMLFEGNYITPFRNAFSFQQAYPTLYLFITFGPPIFFFIALCFMIFITSFI